jgi:hypothetical protein
MNWGLVSLLAVDIVPENEQQTLTTNVDDMMTKRRGFTQFAAFDSFLAERYRHRQAKQTAASLIRRSSRGSRAATRPPQLRQVRMAGNRAPACASDPYRAREQVILPNAIVLQVLLDERLVGVSEFLEPGGV